MSALNTLIQWKERNPHINNIVLFISDSLRWDYTPTMVSDLGCKFKTVASSIFTPPSFASIITGLYPNNHGVFSFFNNKLTNDVNTVLNLKNYNTSLWTENTWIGLNESSPLHRILNCNNHISLDDIEPPFIYIEDEKGGHCPYGWSINENKYEEWDCVNFFKDMGKKEKKELRIEYKKGIERSINIFNKRLNTITKRGLKNNTLIIFSSDHGEILGEYGGLVGHGNITVPEVVYVPVIFIHPDLPKGKNFANEGVLRHVDLFPTICDILNVNIKNNLDGINLFKSNKLCDYGYCYYYSKKNFNNFILQYFNYFIKEHSIWDKNGGYVIKKGNIFKIFLKTLHETLLSKNNILSIYRREQIKNNFSIGFLYDYFKSFKTYFLPYNKYGNPCLNLDDILNKQINKNINHFDR